MKNIGIAAVAGCFAFASLAHAQGLATAGASRMLADANGDGKVTSVEYQKSRRDFIMSRADRNKDGKVTLDEWNKAAATLRSQYEFDGVENAQLIGQGNWFQMIDANKDKVIDAAEIDKMTADRFAKLDANHDGSVDRTEGKRLQMAAQKEARAATK